MMDRQTHLFLILSNDGYSINLHNLIPWLQGTGLQAAGESREDQAGGGGAGLNGRGIRALFCVPGIMETKTESYIRRYRLNLPLYDIF